MGMNCSGGFHQSGDCCSTSEAGGGVTIGDLVTGGTNNRVLYIDNTGALAVSASLAFSAGRLTVGGLTSTGTIVGSNGVAAGTPDFAFTGDTDTGLFSPAANQLSVAIGGVESMRVGAALGTPVDATMSMGRCLLDSRSTNIAYFSHVLMTSTTNYALFQNSLGAVRVNCASGQTLGLYANNVVKLSVSTTGLGLYNATPVAQQTVTGSRGGATVAVLADLLTKLATLGAIVDGTTA